MQKDSKILVLGGRGLVGSAIVRTLKKNGYKNILAPIREELNLLSQEQTLNYFSEKKPEYVFDAAAKVGGIMANNSYRADFIFENLSIQNNIFEASFKHKIKKLLFLGSSCIYPVDCPKPIKEEYLLTAPLEPTNEPYAIAKIAGLKTAENFNKQYGCQYYSAMPTNLYGEGDNFHPENSHVIPGLIQRMEKTIENGDQTFEVWGTGKPMREFLYVDDMAEACLFLMEYEGHLPNWINIGTGTDVTIKELVETIADVMGFKGELTFNTKKPDGMMRKVMDVSKINNLGWKAKTSLKEGIKKTVEFYKSHKDTVRKK